jgi:predicted MFS family arabinose efflux permease
MRTESKSSDPTQSWVMLLALTTAFAMSQAFRTVAAVLATPLQAEFHLSPQQLGTFAGAFHFAFGAMQLFVGIGIDLHGVRRTVLTGFPLAVAGAVLSALAPSYGALVFGQVLIGVGCAPAFLACTVFIARHFAPARFAAMSGTVMSVGGVGLLATGTPLAWLVQASSWRMGFWVLGGCSIAAWALIAWKVHEPPSSKAEPDGPRESLGRAALTFAALFRLPYTPGIVALSFVCYASFISLRGLWLGPMLIERHGFSLVQSGNVALAVSLVSLISPSVFGRLDPGNDKRRSWLIGWALVSAAMFAALALLRDAVADIALTLAIGMLSGFMILQYAQVRAAYPERIVGRALGLFTMSMFLGVAVMQWFTGLVASIAKSQGTEIFAPVLLTIAALLAVGTLAFAWLPKAPSKQVVDSA